MVPFMFWYLKRLGRRRDSNEQWTTALQIPSRWISLFFFTKRSCEIKNVLGQLLGTSQFVSTKIFPDIQNLLVKLPIIFKPSDCEDDSTKIFKKLFVTMKLVLGTFFHILCILIVSASFIQEGNSIHFCIIQKSDNLNKNSD